MRSRIIFVVLAMSVMCAFIPKVSAFEQAAVLEYFNNGDEITAYISNTDGNNISCRIAGVECNAEMNGNVYSDSEMYKTLFLVDSSKSMSAYSDEISEFILECIDKKQNNEYYSISVFGSGHEPTALIDFDNDRYALEKSVANITYTFDSSYIFDNLDNAVDRLMNDGESCYKRIVLFTDGCENSAVGITVEDVISQVKSTPVSVYTITLLDSKKSNYEQLKTVARIARESNASDIRINADTDIKNAAAILAEDAQSISAVTIYPENTLADGSVKAVEIVSGEMKITADIRMPMSVIAAETTAASEIPTGTESVSVVEEADENNAVDVSKLIVPIAIGVAVIAIVVLIVILVGGRKKSNTENEEGETLLVSDADNDDTMLMSSRSGDTEMFFDEDDNKSIILRDKNDSVHSFETSLSGMVVIGRSSDVSTLVIDYDKSISKKHCKIYMRGNDVYIEDLGSANKTYVNDTLVTAPQIIRTSDEIKLGRLKFSVTIK